MNQCPHTRINLQTRTHAHVQVVKLLLKHRREAISVVDPDGRTAIHWASKHPSTKSIDVFLKVSSVSAGVFLG